MVVRPVVVCAVAFFSVLNCLAQDVYLAPLKKIKVSEKEVNSISFSSYSKWIAISDAKGETSIRTMADDEVVGKIPTSEVVIYDFIDQDTKIMLLDNSGKFIHFNNATEDNQS